MDPQLCSGSSEAFVERSHLRIIVTAPRLRDLYTVIRLSVP